MRKKLSLLLIPFLISACHRNFVNPPENETYASYSAVIMPHSKKAVVTSKDINTANYDHLVYLKMNNFSSINTEEFKDYMMIAFADIGFFEKVVTKAPTIYINTTPDDKQKLHGRIWYNSYDPFSLEAIRNKYHEDGKNFIIAEATLRQNSPTERMALKEYVFDLKLIDAETGQALFYARDDADNWFGVDQTIVNPVLNEAISWLEQNSSKYKLVQKQQVEPVS